MIECIKIFFAIVVIVQFLFLLIFFLPLRKAAYKNTYLESTKLGWPEISIVLIVKNELSNLVELIPLLLSLEYKGKFDIHILDDASNDATLEYVNKIIAKYGQLKWHTSPYKNSVGKKQRILDLTYIETYPIILFTDADCRPGLDWISSMAANAVNQKIVLGFSPYFINTGFINNVIQFETGLTALLYMGLANQGWAYMGVGRNILYDRSILLSSHNLTKYKSVLSGDDDLTVNELRKMHKTGINLSPESFVYSIPKTSLTGWINQKQRHVSTARYYNRMDQVLLFTYYCTHTAWWIGILILFFIDINLAVLGIGLKMVWYVAFRHLNSKIFKYVFTWTKMISADMAYTFFLFYLLPSASFKKIVKW